MALCKVDGAGASDSWGTGPKKYVNPEKNLADIFTEAKNLKNNGTDRENTIPPDPSDPNRSTLGSTDGSRNDETQKENTTPPDPNDPNRSTPGKPKGLDSNNETDEMYVPPNPDAPQQVTNDGNPFDSDTEKKVQKRIRNGRLEIVAPDGKIYDLQGNPIQ